MENARYIYFKVRFNNFRDVSGSTANEVTDREEWDECECVLCLPDSYSEMGEETPLILSCHGAGSVVREDGGRTGGVAYCSECIKRGYAVATACYGEIFPDNLDGFRKSCFTLFYDDLRPDCEIPLSELLAGRRRNIGGYVAWAWGYCRIADALEKLGVTDNSKLACVGHSRLAVASLLAGVYDERFKMVCCNNSGSGGAQLNRRKFGSMLQVLRVCRSNWVCDNMVQYIGREDTMPFDQHQLLALVAPRGLYVASSGKDLNADPYGTFLSVKEASKIWNLYGLKGLECEEMPPENSPVGCMARYHVKTGKHSITPYDWEQYLNFADELFDRKNS